MYFLSTKAIWDGILAKRLFCLQDCVSVAISLPRTRVRLSAMLHSKRETLGPCSLFCPKDLSWSQTYFLFPALPLCVTWLYASHSNLLETFHTLYILSGLDPLQIARSIKRYVADRSQYLCFCNKNSGKEATLHHVFLRCLTPGSADLLQIINSHQIAYLSTNSGSEEDKIIQLQKPSLAFLCIFSILISSSI